MEKTTYQGALCSALLTKYSGDQIRKTEMGGACSTYGRWKRRIQDYGEENLKMDLPVVEWEAWTG